MHTYVSPLLIIPNMYKHMVCVQGHIDIGEGEEVYFEGTEVMC